MKTCFLLVVLFFIGSSAVSAQEVRDSWLLYEFDGDVFAVEVQSRDTYNLTEDVREEATMPYWSTDGKYVTFVLTEELSTSRNEPSYGKIAWVEFGESDISYVPRCQRSVVCTDAAMSGDYIVFTALRVRDDYPVLYFHDVETEESDILQSGGFYPAYIGNGWDNGEYLVFGQFGGTRQVARIYDVPGPGYETDPYAGISGVGHLGCNYEAATQIRRGSRNYVEVQFDGSFDSFEFEGVLGRGRVWRNCRARQPRF